MPKGSYRWKTFKHWTNLAFLGGAGIAAAAGGGLPLLGLALLAEGALMWIAPDMKSVQRALDQDGKTESLEAKRRYYVQALWNVTPPKGSALGMIVEERPNWRAVISDEWGRRISDEQRTFLRLLDIVGELETIHQHRPEAVAPAQVEQIDDAINAWLQRLYIARGLKARLGTMSQADLVDEFEQLQEKARTAEGRADKIVIGERLRTLKQKVEELPKLEQRLGLSIAEAERIVDDIEAFLLQVKTAGTADASMLEGMVDRYNLLDSDFDRVLVAAEVRSMVTGVDDQDAWAEVAKGLGMEPEKERA